MSYRRKSPVWEVFRFIPNSYHIFPDWFSEAVESGKVKLIECHCGACKDRGKYEISGCTITDAFNEPQECADGDVVLMDENGHLSVLSYEMFCDRFEPN